MQNFFVKNKSIVTFLILEIVALTAFNFGNIGYIFGLAGSLLALIGLAFYVGISKNYCELLWILIPFAVLLGVSSLGAFNAYSKIYSNGISKLSNISLFLSLPLFLILGFCVRKFKDTKPKTVLFVVGGGFAAITLFGLFSTIIQYGFFYSLIYKSTPNYFYNGMPYDVTKEMFWLTGFEFSEVFIEYGSLFAILCAAFVPGLLFISPIKERNDFIICAAIGGVGLLTLAVIPNLKALIILAIIVALAAAYKFLREYKILLISLGILIVFVVLLGVTFYTMAIINAASGFKFGGILNRVFVSNRIITESTNVLQTLFKKKNGELINLFGFTSTLENEKVIIAETNIFEMELLKEIGLVGAYIFIGFVIFMGHFLYKYLRKSKDSDFIKVSLIAMVLCFFAFESVSHILKIGPHSETYTPFLRNPALLVIIFIFGYTFIAPGEEENE